MKSSAKTLPGYTIADGCHIVLGAQIFRGALDDGQLSVKLTGVDTVNWLLRLPQAKRDAVLKEVMKAADSVLSDAYDDHLRTLAYSNAQRTRKPAIAAT